MGIKKEVKNVGMTWFLFVTGLHCKILTEGLIRGGRPERALSRPAIIGEPYRQRKGSFFLARMQPMKSHGLFCLL